MLASAVARAAAPTETRPPVPFLVRESTITVVPGETATVEGTLELVVLETGPVVLSLVDTQVAIRSVSVDGVPAGLMDSVEALTLLGRWSAGVHTVRFSGLAQTTGDDTTGSLSLRLPASARSRVVVSNAEDRAVEVGASVALNDGQYRIQPQSKEPVQISWRAKGPEPVRPRTVHADQQTVLSVDEAETVVRTRVDLRVANGALDTLVMQVPGGAEAVEVLSPAGATGQVSGQQLTVRLSGPITDVARIDLRCRATPAGESTGAVPLPVVSGARGTHTVALLRGDDAVVIPEAVGRADALAFADLPEGMGARLPGARVAAFSLSDGARLSWRRLETTPAPEPPVLIDHAL